MLQHGTRSHCAGHPADAGQGHTSAGARRDLPKCRSHPRVRGARRDAWLKCLRQAFSVTRALRSWRCESAVSPSYTSTSALQLARDCAQAGKDKVPSLDAGITSGMCE